MALSRTHIFSADYFCPAIALLSPAIEPRRIFDADTLFRWVLQSGSNKVLCPRLGGRESFGQDIPRALEAH